MGCGEEAQEEGDMCILTAECVVQQKLREHCTTIITPIKKCINQAMSFFLIQPTDDFPTSFK